jgi:transposase
VSNLFWLTERQLEAIEGAIPKNRPGVKPGRNLEIISGIIHVLKTGCRWVDCPSEYGPHTTVYNRFNRWSKAGLWAKVLEKLVLHDAMDIQCIDSTTAKAHRCSAGGKGGPRRKPSGAVVVVEPRKYIPLSMRTGASSHSN